MNDVAQRLEQVLARIRAAEQAAGRSRGSVSLVAVSKGQPVARLVVAARAGQKAFGENYLQEALGKIPHLLEYQSEWHFIGPLQANKTKLVAENFDWLHSLERLRVAERLSRQRPEHAQALQVCLQVNVSGEASKSGLRPQDTPALAEAVAALPGLRLRGLMAIPEATPEPRRQRLAFARLRELLERLQSSLPELDTLSMGMSEDLEAAVHEGATMVRIGTALFGPRAATDTPNQTRSQRGNSI